MCRTMLTKGLAVAFANSGYSVGIIDSDFRNVFRAPTPNGKELVCDAWAVVRENVLVVDADIKPDDYDERSVDTEEFLVGKLSQAINSAYKQLGDDAIILIDTISHSTVMIQAMDAVADVALVPFSPSPIGWAPTVKTMDMLTVPTSAVVVQDENLDDSPGSEDIAEELRQEMMSVMSLHCSRILNAKPKWADEFHDANIFANELFAGSYEEIADELIAQWNEDKILITH